MWICNFFLNSPWHNSELLYKPLTFNFISILNRSFTGLIWEKSPWENLIIDFIHCCTVWTYSLLNFFTAVLSSVWDMQCKRDPRKITFVHWKKWPWPIREQFLRFLWKPPHLPGVNLNWRWAKMGSCSKLPWALWGLDSNSPGSKQLVVQVCSIERRLGTFCKTWTSPGVLLSSDW